MTDQPPPHDPYAKPPSGASAVPPPPGADAQPGSWSSPDSPPPGEYGSPPPPSPYGAPDTSAGYAAPPVPTYGTPPTYGAPPIGGAPLGPEASSVRTQGIVWTVINGISVLFCLNLVFGIIGLIFGILGITRSSTDVAAARRNVRISWIMFVVAVVLAIIGTVLFFTALGSSSDFREGLEDGYNSSNS